MASPAFALCSRVRRAVLTAALIASAIAAAAAQTPLRPSAVAYDASGNLYFADTNRNQVFEIALSGALTLIAGNGTQGFSGDGAAATVAELNAPQGLGIGPDGTVYIADTGNQRIRAIHDGIITTDAGTGTPGYSGDNAPAINAELNSPTALAIGADGTVYVADTGNQRVRGIAPQGIITTLAGNGTQGYSGDNGPATAAELNSPSGLAISSDGTLLIADTGNQRVRSVSPQGILTTIAGNGIQGYSGDGAAATAAELSQPRGLAIDASGTLFIADTGNQRLRSLSVQGILTTLAGNGTQGFSQDGVPVATIELNNPTSIAVSPTGLIAFTDTSNSLVRTIANGEVFTLAPAPATSTRTSSVQLILPASTIYGQGAATVTVQSNAAPPQGTVTLLNGATLLATATLNSGSASFALSTLSPGSHTLTAVYPGDSLAPAATSAAFAVNITAAPITATATNATISYGEPIPALTGTTTGILPQDASSLTVTFTTSATALSPVGDYPILATLTGPAASNYALSTGSTSSSTSGTLQILQAQTSVTMPPVVAQSYVGLPLLLTATVASQTSGTPTGEVDFDDGSTVIARSICVNGTASATYPSPPTGAHSFTAIYLGDTNFLGSTSSIVTTSIAAMPDFTMASSSPSQTVQGGLIATFPLTLTPQGGAFTGSVTFSVSGLPAGAIASFSPSTVVPGATGAAVTMSIQTTALALARHTGTTIFWVFCLPIGILALRRRKPRLLVLSFLLASAIGCGARTTSSGTTIASHSTSLTVTATSTNLAGAVVAHSTVVTLLIQ